MAYNQGGGYGNNGKAYQSGFGGGQSGFGGGAGGGGGGGYGNNTRPAAQPNNGYGGSNGRYNGNEAEGEDPLVSAVTENIKSMATNVGQISKWINMLGTNRDSQDLRDRLQGTIETTKILARDTTAQLKQLSSHTGGRNNKMVHEKLTKDFSVWLQKFHDITKVSAQKERSLPPPSRPSQPQPQQQQQGGPKQPDTFPQAYGNYDDYHSTAEKQGLLEQSRRQQLMQIENEREFNDALIRDREQGIKQIESAVVEVNEIFTDLANLVHEQGFMIDNIESNIESTAIQTQEGVVQLQKASQHQRSARSKMCILAIIIAVIAAVLTLVLVFSLK